MLVFGAVCQSRLAYVLAVVGLVGGTAVGAETPLGTGDRISFSVVGSPDFETVGTIDTDGNVSLPFVGTLQATGRTIDDLTAEIREELAVESIRLRDPGGQDEWVILDPAHVYLTVAEYRPIYVLGDVRQSGERPFRPGMTARQALALAGGTGVAEGQASVAELAGLAADREVLEQQIALTESEIARLDAELASFDAELELPKDLTGEEDPVVATARRWLAARINLRDLRRQNADLSQASMQDRLQTLEQLQAVSDETLEIDAEEYERIRSLAERGVSTASNLADARRSFLSSSSRSLEVASETSRLETEMRRLSEQADTLLTQDRIDTLSRLTQENIRLSELEARHEALSTRMLTMGAVGMSDARIETVVTVHRQGAEGEPLQAGLDTTLQPGDVIEFIQRTGDAN